MQLTPGQMADQWFQSLDSRHTTTFAALKTAFFKTVAASETTQIISRAAERARGCACAEKE
jgi:DNA-binding transcriptional regulator YbjK